MTLEEYNNSSEPTPGTSVVMVEEHKGDKPARVVASGEIVQELRMWVTLLRPLLVAGESPYLFCSEEGKKLTQLSRCVMDLSKRFNITLPTATVVRKAIATVGGVLGEKQKEALAHSMSHTRATADTYYRAYGETKSLVGYDTVGRILDIPLTKKRQRFSTQQTEAIKKRFSAEIEAAIQPSGEAIDLFLAENKELFPRRKRGDIYSKVRNLIGRR